MPKGQKSKADISNTAIRVFLQMVGISYDEARGLEPFKPSREQCKEVLEFFNSCCCYCDMKIGLEEFTSDHLIPVNKSFLGLHAWGNVVPCCGKCNKAKHNQPWRDFIIGAHKGKEGKARTKRIEDFIFHYRYKPTIDLQQIATNLYQDVGEVAWTLIQLRFQQAKTSIEKIHGVESSEKNNLLNP
ncbi:MAG: HNH endonuclease [Planctomycetes bacterium]|nr:HNH endonuclease [Planctomycetota bacterium]